MLGFFQNIGMPELLIILVILILLFGATKIPPLARSLGKSVNEFKKGMHESEDVTKKAEEKPEDKKQGLNP
jgi:sec-independent protein translocase protein TatA